MNISRNTAIAVGAMAVLIVIGVYALSGEIPGLRGDTRATGQETIRQTPTAMMIAGTFTPVTGTTVPTLVPTTEFTLPATPSLTLTPAKRPVEFILDSGAAVNCGLTCRETTATITNIGDEVAHSVCVVLEVFNENGERIFINSAPSIEQCLGDIEGGTSRSETVTIHADCGFLAGRCIGHTLVLKTRATSLEKSQVFPDSYLVV